MLYTEQDDTYSDGLDVGIFDSKSICPQFSYRLGLVACLDKALHGTMCQSTKQAKMSCNNISSGHPCTFSHPVTV